MIAHYRGKYMDGWDKLREARHARQIEMGIVDPALAALAAAGRFAGLGHAAPDRKDRFDAIMAVYAAMIECIDRSVGKLVAGLEGTRRAGQHADRFPERQRRQRGERPGGRHQAARDRSAARSRTSCWA